MNVDAKVVLDALALAISVCVGIYAFFSSRRKDVDTRLNQVNDRLGEGSRRMDRIDNRVKTVEDAIEAMPCKEDLHSVSLALADLRGDIKAVNATLTAVKQSIERTETIVTRHEDHLMKGSG